MTLLLVALPATADLTDLPRTPEVYDGEQPDIWLPPVSVATDSIIEESGDGTVTLVCKFEDGQAQCQGFVCTSSPMRDDVPFTLGDPTTGRGFGVDAAASGGKYGPYTGVFVHTGGTCVE